MYSRLRLQNRIISLSKNILRFRAYPHKVKTFSLQESTLSIELAGTETFSLLDENMFADNNRRVSVTILAHVIYQETKSVFAFEFVGYIPHVRLFLARQSSRLFWHPADCKSINFISS